ncbi:MAG: hypothetical protein IPK00_11950 [Deltaproteobacteria bacterium]|nr:hypothetical protein [Deltaproteobacteria bacterium]
MAERWRRCSACKQDIGLSSVYWVCSVSTCNRARTALVFCSVDCWEIHLPTERHRVAWAVEKRAPKVPDAADGSASSKSVAAKAAAAAGAKPGAAGGPRAGAEGGVRPGSMGVARPTSTGGRPAGAVGNAAEDQDRSDPTDVLVVANKLKTYIREGSGFNTSDRVLLVLSDVLRKLCDDAIRNAKRAGRDIVTDRDLPPSA